MQKTSLIGLDDFRKVVPAYLPDGVILQMLHTLAANETPVLDIQSCVSGTTIDKPDPFVDVTGFCSEADESLLYRARFQFMEGWELLDIVLEECPF